MREPALALDALCPHAMTRLLLMSGMLFRVGAAVVSTAQELDAPLSAVHTLGDMPPGQPVVDRAGTQVEMPAWQGFCQDEISLGGQMKL